MFYPILPSLCLVCSPDWCTLPDATRHWVTCPPKVNSKYENTFTLSGGGIPWASKVASVEVVGNLTRRTPTSAQPVVRSTVGNEIFMQPNVVTNDELTFQIYFRYAGNYTVSSIVSLSADPETHCLRSY
jgi:hypothetical protein